MTTSHTPRRRFTKRTAVLTAVGVALGTGTAYALVTASLEMGGSIQRGASFDVSWVAGSSYETSNGGEARPTNRMGGIAGPLTFRDMPAMDPGDSFTVTPEAYAKTQRGGYVSGVTGTPGEGWRVSIAPESCGKVLPTGSSAAVPLTIKVEATGAGGTLDMSKVKVQATSDAPPSSVTCTAAGAN